MTTEWKENLTPQELFALNPKEWEIELQTDVGNDKYCPWREWDGTTWHHAYLYRARPRQPVIKNVKYLCWHSHDDGALHWVVEGTEWPVGYLRQPKLDLEGEMQE